MFPNLITDEYKKDKIFLSIISIVRKHFQTLVNPFHNRHGGNVGVSSAFSGDSAHVMGEGKKMQLIIWRKRNQFTGIMKTK